MAQNNKDVEEIFRLITGFFEGDIDKAHLWMKLPNPLLGNVSPTNMIAWGRVEKLKNFVVTSLEENKRSVDK